LSAQKTTGRLYTDLEVEKQNVARLVDEARNRGDSKALESEVARLRDELSQRLRATPSGGVPGNVAALVSAVGPMLWGLEQAIKYLEPFGASEAQLAAHVKQLQLLEKVLQRLATESAS
jgi:hypothetical protein